MTQDHFQLGVPLCEIKPGSKKLMYSKATFYTGLPKRQTRNRLIQTSVILTVLMALNACETSTSFERHADGVVQNLDQLSEAEKAAARAKIAQTLINGLTEYDLRIGDEFEVFFHIDRKPTAAEYAISISDKLRIEFLNETDSDRVVQVRPDGRISVPLLGAVVAAGKTVDGLTAELEHSYTNRLTQPKITINVAETHSSLDEFIDSIGTSKSRSVVDKILPDGTLSLPSLPPIPARGRTIAQLEDEIAATYSKAGLNVSVSLIPRTLQAGSALVLGEVLKPGRVDTDKPQTVLMTVAAAGGVLTTGSMQAVRIIYFADDGQPRLRSINLAEEIDGLKLEQDMIVPPNSLIYVPPTNLAKTGRLLDAVLRDILRFQGFNFGANYLINNGTSSSSVVVPTSR